MAKVPAIRDVRSQDAEALALIYNQGIEDRVATFETDMRDAGERRAWLDGHDAKHPVIVAEDETGEVVGWAAIAPISERPCYSGVGEYSVYVRDGPPRSPDREGFVARILEADREGVHVQRSHHQPREEIRVQGGRSAAEAREAGREMARRARDGEAVSGESR